MTKSSDILFASPWILNWSCRTGTRKFSPLTNIPLKLISVECRRSTISGLGAKRRISNVHYLWFCSTRHLTVGFFTVHNCINHGSPFTANKQNYGLLRIPERYKYTVDIPMKYLNAKPVQTLDVPTDESVSAPKDIWWILTGGGFGAVVFLIVMMLTIFVLYRRKNQSSL